MKSHFQGGASLPASRFLKMFTTARGDARPTKFVLPFLAAMIFLAAGARAETTNALSDAEIQGRKLAQQLYNARPQQNFTNSGTLKIRDAKGVTTEILLQVKTTLGPTNWKIDYQTFGEDVNQSNRIVEIRKMEGHVGFVFEHSDEFKLFSLTIDHRENLPNSHFYWTLFVHLGAGRQSVLGSDTTPFADSDFWLADLGLEFFHWPEQKILKKEVKRSRGCSVLESTNPDPSTNGYSRVVSWIDEESGGIVQAFAYDARGKLLKEFYPKDFKKVDGQWQVQEMEIINDQTGSRTRLEFDLNKK